MNPHPSPQKQFLKISVDASHPQLLNALESWLELGIITQDQVKSWGQQYLSCDFIPPVPTVPTIPAPRDFAEESLAVAQPVLRVQRSPGFWSAFRDELSVRWLLFLGLFLVVMSSGVLAATQWHRVSFLGQYLILFCYTLMTWGIGFWAKRQERLLITSQSLQTLAILLIPINFWAMDSLQLHRSLGGLICSALAGLILIAIYGFYSRLRFFSPLFLLFAGLSLAQGGWRLPLFPLIAIYGGLIGFAGYLFFGRTISFNKTNLLSLYGVSILLFRGIFIINLPRENLTLAIGLYGWIIQYMSLNSETNKLNKFLENLGTVILVSNWYIATNFSYIWQTIILAGLSLKLLWRRLQEKSQSIDIIFIFIIGLVTYLKLPQINSLSSQKLIGNFFNNVLTGTTNSQYAIYGITLFPYLWIWRWISRKLYRQNKQQLAQLAGLMTLALGVVLTSFTLTHPRAQSLNLWLTTLTIAYTTYRIRPVRYNLVYGTHIFSIVALISTIDWLFSPLTTYQWYTIFLSLGIMQWLISALQKSNSTLTFFQAWYKSSWSLAFVSATISYYFLLNTLNIIEPKSLILTCFSVPIILTILAYYRGIETRKLAIWGSTIAVVLAQIGTFSFPNIRIISLGLGAVILLTNSLGLADLFLTRLQVAFSVLWGLVWIGEILKGENFWGVIFSQANWMLAQGVGVGILWLFYLLSKRYPNYLLSLYSQSTHEWGTLLCGFTLAQLSIGILSHVISPVAPQILWRLVCLLLLGLILVRSWRSLNNLRVYGIIWAVELFLIETAQSRLIIATFNIITGLFLAITVPWLNKKLSWLNNAPVLKLSPLFFAVMGIIWRLGYLTNQTGWLTLGVAAILLGVSYQVRERRALSSLAVLSFSVGIYEWVIYRLLLVRGGDILNGLLVLGLVAAGLGAIYRLIAWRGKLKGYTCIGSIALSDLKSIAHLHWTIGSIFKILTLAYSWVVFGILTGQISPQQPTLTLLLLSLSLSVYAFLEGRNLQGGERWVYGGFWDTIETIIVARLLWKSLAFLDPFYGAIVGVIAILISYAPWTDWGWNIKPWRRVVVVIPWIVALLTCLAISDLSLILLASVYLQVGISRDNLRWSYLSLGFINWLVLRFFFNYHWQDNILIALVVGLSILYVPMVDPFLKQAHQRLARHNWRILGSAVIAVTALVFYQKTGLIPSIIGITTLLIGLGWRIRAFLYVGTITFILTVLYQLVVLNFQYSFAKWIIGLALGILFILVAANFEQRREQIQRLWQNCLEELARWE